ncbi:major facilitator superfamily domain-containing protein [Leucosporidium creatinivorum]|uniref:Lysosomal dipeptide transporter MFSD1 n=1 Tax=Leucosporidium creatinivorum TaxID=106004 RepID=A0A1Y2ERW9_9BASI|nr:major facilitator superfamily domain-containing protein [Leucosporidium creatinivorum]
MLACACCLSVGSHFGSHLLGPLKTTLKTSESEFAALVSAGSLINTLTPLISGLLVPKFGPAKVGLVSTGLVLLGHLIVCWRERGNGDIDVGGMVSGLLLAGAGASPLSVVQESIILRCSDGHSVAKTVALGLLLGKTASFVSAAVSHPLSQINSRLPFITAATLSAFSFSACFLYYVLERCLVPQTEDEDERLQHLYHTKGRALRLAELKRFPGRFWIYALVCCLVGAWDAFTRLSSSLLQTFYAISPSAAGFAVSAIPFSSIILYPLLGVLIDRHAHALRRLWYLLPTSMALSCLVLLFLTDLVPYWLAFVPSALGLGAGPLMTVLVVPLLVERHQAPTALGAHKSLEQAGGIIVQFGTSLLLKGWADKLLAARAVVTFLLGLFLVQLVVVTVWWRVIRNSRSLRRVDGGVEYTAVVDEEEEEDSGESDGSDLEDEERAVTLDKETRDQLRRSKISFYSAATFIATSWVIFAYNMTLKK